MTVSGVRGVSPPPWDGPGVGKLGLAPPPERVPPPLPGAEAPPPDDRLSLDPLTGAGALGPPSGAAPAVCASRCIGWKGFLRAKVLRADPWLNESDAVARMALSAGRKGDRRFPL